MQGKTGKRRIGTMGWAAITLTLLAAVLFGGWKWALANNAVALLDWADRQFGENAGYAVALADGHYGPLAAQKIEVIVPAGPSERLRPVVVFIHGGGWNSGTPGDYRFIGRTLAREGYVVVLSGYRLGPEGRYPVMLEDSALAVVWVRQHAAQYGGDLDRVFLMGHSAGAYNVMMLGLERQWLGRVGVPDTFIKGVIGLSGPYDFYPYTSDSTRAAFGQAADGPSTQPIHFVRVDAPPLLLVTGDADVTVKARNSEALATAMTALGRPMRPVVLAGADHSDTIMKLAAPFNRDRRVLDPVLAFLTAQCKPSAPVKLPRP